MRHVRLYRAVDAVARYRSIRRAAAELAISPSALNRQILGLEDELGIALFERLARGVRLSTAGEIYLSCFRSHVAELERAASQVADLSGLRMGTVRFGVGPELASFFAPRVVAEYRRAHPRIDVALSTVPFDGVAAALGSFEVDVVAAVNPLMDDGIETFGAEETGILCVSAGGLGQGGGLRLSGLADRPLIVPSVRSGLRNAVDALFAARGVPRRYAIVTDRSDLVALRTDPQAVQIMAALDADRSSLAQAGLAVAPLDAGSGSRPLVKLMRSRARVLPVASAKFAETLVRAIA